MRPLRALPPGRPGAGPGHETASGRPGRGLPAGGGAFLSVLLLCGCGGAEAPTYAACEEGGDCAAEVDECFEVLLTHPDGSDGAGRLCSRHCARDADCPDDGVCLALAHDPGRSYLCWSRCAGDGSCGAGFACLSVDGAPGVDAVCLP